MHIEHVTINIAQPGAIGAALMSALLSTPTPGGDAAPASNALTPPAIGAYWPGQGGVYVGLGRGYDGVPDHPLILATDPRSVFAKRALGTYGVDVAGATSDHDAMANTVALANAGSELCKEILALEIDGHTDFSLMSRTDARLCMANVPEQFEKEWYLTSTQYSSTTAWGQLFYNGRQNDLSKKFEALSRAVRRLVR